MTPCAWCKVKPVERTGQRFCGKRCRQAAYRLRRQSSVRTAAGLEAGARFAYADPPYIGLAHYYADQPSYAGEVDHRELVARLTSGGYAGWALSASSASLRELLPLCPAGTRVCAWVKPIGVPSATQGLHSRWEPLLVAGGRRRQPGIRDWLRAAPARGGEGPKLIGRKPLAFCAWLFDALGMVPGDELVDLFPGTGIVGRAWEELSAQVSSLEQRHPPPVDGRRNGAVLEELRHRTVFASLLQEGDASAEAAP